MACFSGFKLAVLVSLVLMSCSHTTPTRPAAASAAATSAEPAAGRGHDQLAAYGDGTLGAFYDALRRIEHGAGTKPVTILQIGDSLTASDGFTGRLRDLFQARFGTAGRGMLPAGIPYRAYKPAGVKVAMQGDWAQFSSFSRNPTGRFGLTGVRIRGTATRDVAALEFLAPDGVDQVLLDLLPQPGGGMLDLAADDIPLPAVSTALRAGGVETVRLAVPSGTHRLTLHPRGDGPVDILGWGGQRRGPGIIVDNFGTIGAAIDLVASWDPALMKAEMAVLDPSLVIVAFGTNEAYGPKIDPESYRHRYEASFQALRAAAPMAAFLLIGPPDGARLSSSPSNQICGPGEADPKKPGSAARVWSVPGDLAVIRDIIHEIAGRAGAYYWDWSQAMGGPCAIDRWARLPEPLAMQDRVHLRTGGYRITADRLFDELMQHYAASQTAQVLH